MLPAAGLRSRGAVGAEGQQVEPRMPVGIAVEALIVGQLGQGAGGEIEQKEVGGAAAAGAGEGDPAAPGRPGRRRQGHQLLEGEPLPAPPLLQVPQDQVVAAVALGHEGQHPAVGRHVETGAQGMEGLVLGLALAGHHQAVPAAADAGPGDGGIALVVAEEHEGDGVGWQLAARGRGDDRRLQVVSGARERVRQAPRRLTLVDVGQVVLLHAVDPGRVEIGQALAGGGLEDAAELLAAPPVVQQPGEDVLAVALGHEVADRLAFLVHLEGAVDPVHPGDGGQAAAEHGVAQDHVGIAVLGTGEVLGEPLGEPEGAEPDVGGAAAAQDRADAVEHEDVDQLVVQDPLEVGVGAAQGQGHPPLEELREAGHPLREQARHDVGLLEVDVGGVDDERHPAAHGVGEAALQAAEAFLRHARRDRRQLLLLRIEVDVEVLGLHPLPGELVVLDLVLAETVGLGPGRCRRQQDRRQQRRQSAGQGQPSCR